MPSNVNAGWADPSVAQMYALAEAASGPFARAALEQAGIQNHSGSPLAVFDMACGTGVVADQLYDLLSDQNDVRKNLKVTCGDTSEAMISHLQNRIKDQGWTGTEAKIMDGMDTKLPSGAYTHAFCTFGIGHMPDPLVALAELHRVLAPGGAVGLAFWHTIDWYREFVRDALETLPGPPRNPSEAEFMGTIMKGRWWEPQWTKETLSAAGFEAVDAVVQKRTFKCGTPAVFASKVLFMPLTVIQNVYWSEEDRERCKPLMTGVIEKRLTEIFGAEGEVVCHGEAVIATGRKK
ncbi:S-adenosyl-L-methionine-dependent methyltransferase [Mytilinidion resinicola]|uniref:S-adenosyl-L-methionine-dependent methyltransferase n=1 Tax=Mytilinidion resinicola TaxID=574789 RepID=A0A6A6Z9A1_9PEZI|nr:S-adenosyl-L-methionine-dependent methyltransferase [Mytilinidion resinicola]KAF2817313.1 S-adenosyl-L-methionine-dependent methyltransferase [Mytilinidion resinicola]